MGSYGRHKQGGTVTTTPERPDEGRTEADATTPPAVPSSAAEQSALPSAHPQAATTEPLHPQAATTEPLAPGPLGVAPAAASAAPAQPFAPPSAPPVPAAPAQQFGPPTSVQPYPGAPHAGQPAAQPYAGQPYAGQPYPGAPYAGQPAGQPYPGAPYAGQPAGQPYPGAPYAGQQAGQPYAGQPAGQAYAGQPPALPATQPPVPGAPTATAEATAPRRRRWLPVLATLVIVALLAVAAVAVASHGLGRASLAGSTVQPGSIATLGSSDNEAVPVAGSTSSNPDWPAVVNAVQSSVVAIDVETSSGEALGSGVVADASGHVVTNNHVVDGEQKIQVTLDDGRVFDATVVGTDATTDLAVLQITDAPDDLVAAEFGDSSKVAVGESVMAVGNPLGLANTVTTGIVSAVDRPVSTATEDGDAVVTNAIQIDAAVNPGNSGGPLFNARGEVIGITSSIATLSSESGSIGLGFAIPSNLVQNVAGQIIDTGSAQHAFLGVGLDDGTATADGVTRRGALVKTVTEDSPASAAGIKVDDVIVAIDGNVVGGAESLTAFVRAMSSGDEVTLTIVRDGKALDITATLAARQETTATPNDSGSGNGNGSDEGSGNGSGDGLGNGSGNGSGNGLPGDMTPEQLWEWLQQQGGNGSGNGQG
jgi:putative serine protease PepD